ncbi:hypothetical protein BKA69DRAFT_1076458 [Paraphysoderma sedebokerense]|nr:hypothetical protein BKA69DRAFT_1076458 [Paraphysoderma sedebokerense]
MESDDNQSNLSPQEFSDGDPPSFSGDEEGTFHQSSSDVEDSESYGEEYEQYAEQDDEDAKMYENQSEGGPPEVIEISDSSDAENESSAEPQEQYEIESNNGEEITPLEQEHEESQEDVEDQPEVETSDQSLSSSKEYENEPQPEEHFQEQGQQQQSEEPILAEASEAGAAIATPRRITRSMTGSISPVRPISSVSPGQRRQSVERGVSQSPSASGERGRRTRRGRTRSSHGSELENDDESRGPSESQISQISVDIEVAEEQQASERQQIARLLPTEEGESSSHQEAEESRNVQSESIFVEEVQGDNQEDVAAPLSPSKLTTAELLSSFPETSADLSMEENIRSNQFRMEDLITMPPEQGEASLDQPKSRSRSPQRSVQAQTLQRSPSPKKAMDIDERYSPATQSATEPKALAKDSTSPVVTDNSRSMSPQPSSSPKRHLVENVEEEYEEVQPTTQRASSPYQAMVVDSPKVRTPSPRRQVAQTSSQTHLQDESQNLDSNPTIAATLHRTPSPVRIQQSSHPTSMDVDEELTIPMNESTPQSNVISNLCAILDIPSSTYLSLLDPRNSHIQDTPEAIMNLFAKMEKILSQSVLNTNREGEEPAAEGSVSEDIAELRAQITELKSEKAVLEVNFEHTTHGHLSTINSLREQIHHMQTELDHFKNEMEKSDKTVSELKQNLAHERDVKERREVELNKLKSRIEGLESEKRDIVRRLGKGIEGKDDYDNLLSRHISLKTENEKLSSELNEYRARQVSIELQRQKMEQELKILTDQNDWLSSELKEKTEEFGQYRKEKSSALLSLQSQVDSLTTQSLSYTQTISHLRTQLSNLQQTHTQTLNELDSLRSQLVSQEADYKSALDTATRSSNLYKTHAEDLQAKVEEMRQISTQLEDAVNDKYLELDAKDSTMENLRKELEDVTKKLNDVTKELEGIKRRGFVSAAESDTTTISALSPTAEMWKQMQESGQSVTDMRDRIHSLDRDLQKSESERKRLEGLLTQVMSEIEERVPEMAETREKCISLVEELEVYKRKEREAGVLRKELEKLTKEHETLKDQHERMHRDLSLQIQGLLQGNFTETENHPIMEFESSEDVITNRLLIFRNIEELQTQNKNLLKALRAAMARLEEVESPLETTQDMYNQINRLKEELALSQQRVASMSNQQEVLRSQLSGRGSVAGSPSPMRTFSRSISPARELELDRERENLKKKEHEFENMKRDLRVNEKMLKDQIDQLRTECGDLRVALAKEKARSDGLLERYNLITSQFETQTHDLATHQTLTSTLQSQLNTAESKLTNLTSENISLQTQLTKINSELTNLQSEKKLWKSIETRLERERSEGQKERERLSKVVEGWGRIQSEFERRMENEKSRWEERVKSLEDELDQTKSKLIESSTELKMISERRDVEINESKSKIESLVNFTILFKVSADSHYPHIRQLI